MITELKVKQELTRYTYNSKDMANAYNLTTHKNTWVLYTWTIRTQEKVVVTVLLVAVKKSQLKAEEDQDFKAKA